MAQQKVLNPKPVEEIPEVAAFEEVRERMKAVRDANAQFFSELDSLAEEYNDKRAAAIRATKAQEVSSGCIVMYQWSTKYDAEVLYQSLGHQGFLNVGGKVSQVADYSIDKARFESAHKSGQINDEVYNRVVTKSPRFKKPDEVHIP
jgi:hypothetical protein